MHGSHKPGGKDWSGRVCLSLTTAFVLLLDKSSFPLKSSCSSLNPLNILRLEGPPCIALDLLQSKHLKGQSGSLWVPPRWFHFCNIGILLPLLANNDMVQQIELKIVHYKKLQINWSGTTFAKNISVVPNLQDYLAHQFDESVLEKTPLNMFQLFLDDDHAINFAFNSWIARQTI